MFQTLQDVTKFLEAHHIEAVDLKFCDLWGRQHHITVPPNQFTTELLESGIGFDGSSIGLKNVKSGDMVMVPDLTTGFLDPFWEAPTLSFLCTALNAADYEIFSNDPRNLTRKAESFLQETGIADESKWGPELEFYIFDEVYYENTNHRAGYELVSYEAEADSDNSPGGSYIPIHGGYHAAPPKDKSFQLRQEITQHLLEMGIPIKYHHHEVGSFGQVEIETTMMGLLEAGDAIKLIKYTAKMAAASRNQAVTFMPKPIFQEAGNGMHFHQHLFLEGNNLFYDPEGYGKLSQLARYYIGGLLHHGPALLGLTNPSTNSYRRLVPGYEAPVNAFYSLGNRSAAIRIPKYANQPDTTRIEFRPPDASCNPYLALASQLLAGIDGIKQELDPSQLGYGPIDEDIFSWSSEQRETIQPLPTSLEEALTALENDYEFLLAGDVFSEELLQEWVEHKREEEIDPVRIRPHPYEISLYFDV
jgi:glutamine synthetase